MLTAGLNQLAMMRLLVVHGGRSANAFGLLLTGIVAVGVFVWALSYPGTSQSGKN
jgi:hypothetical protein